MFVYTKLNKYGNLFLHLGFRCGSDFSTNFTNFRCEREARTWIGTQGTIGQISYVKDEIYGTEGYLVEYLKPSQTDLIFVGFSFDNQIKNLKLAKGLEGVSKGRVEAKDPSYISYLG